MLHTIVRTVSLAGPAGAIPLTGGSLAIAGTSAPVQTLNAKTCRFSYTVRRQFTFVPGMSTGKFAAATGPGAYQVTFAAFARRYTSGRHKGQCDTSNNAKPKAKGAVASFLAAGVITVK